MEVEKIKGWVARDDDRCICFFFSKPRRACYTNKRLYFEEELEEDMIPWVWAVSHDVKDGYFALPHVMFPELNWEDEPIEVELTINPLKNGKEEREGDGV